MSQKISFFAQFQVFFKNKIKSITCLMHYVALHHWSKLQTNLITIQWVTSKKPPRSSLKLYLLLLWKHLKFQNSRTTNQTWMKLGPYMYQLNTFNIPKMRVSIMGEWDGGVQPKTTRKCHEIKRNLTTYFSAITSFLWSVFFVKFCGTLKLILHPSLWFVILFLKCSSWPKTTGRVLSKKNERHIKNTFMGNTNTLKTFNKICTSMMNVSYFLFENSEQ